MIITLLRKPLEGTVADNTLKHGCGAINIDATRIGSGHHLPMGKVTSKKLAGDGGLGAGSGREGERGGFIPRSAEGRWPANFILTHQEGCELKGTKKIKEGKVNRDKGGSLRESGLYEDGLKTRAVDHFQGEETVANWACVEGCSVKELDQQSGEVKSGGRSSKNYADRDSDRLVYGGFSGVEKEIQPSSGGTSRFFKQFKKGND